MVGNVQFVGLPMPQGPLSCVTGDLCVYNFSLGVNFQLPSTKWTDSSQSEPLIVICGLAPS